jgi:hypothetical protein
MSQAIWWGLDEASSTASLVDSLSRSEVWLMDLHR